MVTPVVCSKVAELMPYLNSFYSVKNFEIASDLAIEMARRRTNRQQYLLCVDPDKMSSMKKTTQARECVLIALGDRAQLCMALATSIERFAALVIKPFQSYRSGLPYFFNKARELASAEGAYLICDEMVNLELQNDEYSKLAVRHHPDMVVFNQHDNQGNVFIGVRSAS